MFTLLDLLVIVFMVLIAAGLLALCLMFLVRTPVIKKVSFYTVVALGVYTASVGIRIGMPLFPVQLAVGVAVAIASIAALLLERMGRGDEKKYKAARILAAVSLVVGIINAMI